MSRAVLAAAIVAGVSYIGAWSLDLGAASNLVWKGAGVGLLALYAALLARTRDGWLLTAVLAFGALGDVLLEIDMVAGAAAFAVGHLTAIALYLRNRRPALSRSQKLLALVTVPASSLAGFLLTQNASVAAYAAIVAAMAATAWISRFPRYRTGIGAMMFLASDLLIFARMGPLQEGFAVNLAVWGLYFAGQLLICLGVTQTLVQRAPPRTHLRT